MGRSTDSPTGGSNSPSPFRQWLRGQEPWWASSEEEGRPMPAQAGSDMGGSETEGTSHAGSAFQDGLQHDATAPQPYHYFVVSSRLKTLFCVETPYTLWNGLWCLMFVLTYMPEFHLFQTTEIVLKFLFAVSMTASTNTKPSPLRSACHFFDFSTSAKLTFPISQHQQRLVTCWT